MTTATSNYDELYVEMNEKLDQLSETATSPQQAAESCLTVIRAYLTRLKDYITVNPFPSQADEIAFF